MSHPELHRITVNVTAWRRVVKGVVEGIVDEAMQRRAWFGAGPEIASPGEAVDQFFGDAAIEDFLARSDNGLDEAQTAAGRRLVALMEDLLKETKPEEWMDPDYMIANPRWKAIRAAASEFATGL